MSKKFEKNARVCFVGDSITANGGYIAKVFDYYRTNLPELGVKMYNCGVGGDSARGALKRLDEDVFDKFNPTEIVLMFGMNDCGYPHFADTDVEKRNRDTLEKRKVHLDSMYKLCEAFKAHGLPVTLCSPTPYDESSPLLNETNYIGVRDELTTYFKLYGEALADFTFKNTVDYITPLTALEKELAEKRLPSFINPDRIHPNAMGHDGMAAIFLKSQGFDVTLPTVESLAAGKEVLPPLSAINAERKKYEELLRGWLAFIDFLFSQNLKGKSDEEHIAYWTQKLAETPESDPQHARIANYLEIKPHEKQYFKKLVELTDAMVK